MLPLWKSGPHRSDVQQAEPANARRPRGPEEGGARRPRRVAALFVVFANPSQAVAAAVAAQQALAAHPWAADGVVRVRMGLHTGVPFRTADGYTGLDVVRGARIGATGHGGQVLLSEPVAALV